MDDMNIEVNRYRTFVTWPDNAPVSARALARNGFFATNNFLEAECNWCHLRHKCWQYGEAVEEIHWFWSPTCEFLLNNEDCGNVPEPEQCANATVNGLSNIYLNSADPVDLLVEANRLATFENWPNANISPQSLAKAGFYYLNRADEVKCAWCGGVIAKWEKEDNAFDEHKRFFPNCTRVLLGPLIEIASNGIQSLGIQPNSSPKRPKYSSYDARLRTYTNWPIGNIQRPEDLAQAGLYYLNVDDQVRCFHCNIGMRSWQKEDQPWVEHAKWHPECQFVRLAKGPNFVKQVQELSRETSSSEVPSASATSFAMTPDVVPVSAPTCPRPMTIDEAMSTGPVRQALEMGIDAGAIRTVTQRRLERRAQEYPSVEELVRAVFDEREDDDDDVAGSQEPDVTGIVNMGSLSRDARRLVGSDGRGANCFIVRTSSNRECPCGDTQCEMTSAMTASSTSFSAPTKTVASAPPASTIDSTPKEESTKSSVEAPPAKEQSAESVTRDLEEENRALRDARLCKVCLDLEVGVVFLPCGHLVTCVQCAPGVCACPMCRTDIKGWVRTFLS